MLVAEASAGFGERHANGLVKAFRSKRRPLPVLPEWSAAWSPAWYRDAESWPTGTPDRLALLAELEGHFPAIEDTGVRIGVGVATGADAVFAVRDPRGIEEDRLLPLLSARDVASGKIAWSGTQLVNPWSDTGELVDLGDYPGLAGYLRTHERVLRGRHVAAKRPLTWWRTIDKVTPKLASRPKLVLPDLKDRIQPVLDDGRFYPHHNLYYMVSDSWDPRVLGGLLMSNVAGLFVESYSVRMANGYLRNSAQYLRRIRVPEPQSVTPSLATRLATAFEENDRDAANVAALLAYDLDRFPAAN